MLPPIKVDYYIVDRKNKVIPSCLKPGLRELWLFFLGLKKKSSFM